jgi:hypothetical protein
MMIDAEHTQITIFMTICDPDGRIVELRVVDVETASVEWHIKATGLGTQDYQSLVGEPRPGFHVIVNWDGLNSNLQHLRVEIDLDVEGKVSTERAIFDVENLRSANIRANGSLLLPEEWPAYMEKECTPSKGLLG